jgi:hypothetical protein
MQRLGLPLLVASVGRTYYAAHSRWYRCVLICVNMHGSNNIEQKVSPSARGSEANAVVHGGRVEEERAAARGGVWKPHRL